MEYVLYALLALSIVLVGLYLTGWVIYASMIRPWQKAVGVIGVELPTYNQAIRKIIGVIK